jgi:hypothetical protein
MIYPTVLHTYSDKELCEFDARDFLGDGTWKRWKLLYDDCMAYRKTLKGQPTDEQREQLAANKAWIEFCDHILWHSFTMARRERCICRACDLKRKAKVGK